MSFNQYSNTSISTVAQDTFKNTATLYPIAFAGLKPNARFTLLLDGQDYSWAAAQYGKNIGDPFISDSNGILKLKVLFEIPFSRPAEYDIPETQSVAFYSNRIGEPNNRMEQAITLTYSTFTVISDDGLSSATFRMHHHILLINGDYNKIEQHD